MRQFGWTRRKPKGICRIIARKAIYCNKQLIWSRNKRTYKLQIHDWLVLVKISHLFGCCALFRHLIVSNSNKSRESKCNSLIRIDKSNSSSMNRRDGQISSSNFPHLDGVKPYIWFQITQCAINQIGKIYLFSHDCNCNYNYSVIRIVTVPTCKP